MQARLGFAVAVAIEPDILIVDEVLAVGDEQFQRRCLERMNELRSGGRTAIFVSHGLGQVQQICDEAVWLDKGSIAATGGHGGCDQRLPAQRDAVTPGSTIEVVNASGPVRSDSTSTCCPAR